MRRKERSQDVKTEEGMKKSSKKQTILMLLVIMTAVYLPAVTSCGVNEEVANEEAAKEEMAKEEAAVTEQPESSVSDKQPVAEPERPNADDGTGEPRILAKGDIAPDFTAQLSSGGEFKLSDYDDRTVIVNFWATWCGPCVNEMPAFEMLKNDEMEELEIICINCMEDKDTVDSFVAENGYTFNIGYDPEGKILAYYPTEGIPYTLVVKKGRISKIFVGAMDAETQYREYKDAITE